MDNRELDGLEAIYAAFAIHRFLRIRAAHYKEGTTMEQFLDKFGVRYAYNAAVKLYYQTSNPCWVETMDEDIAKALRHEKVEYKWS